jgi:hypothetical protein
VISGNGNDGILVGLNTGNLVIGNCIGATATGTAGLGSVNNGVEINGARNVISANQKDGLHSSSS